VKAGEAAASDSAARKAELRQRMRGLRSSIPPPERELLARAVANRLFDLEDIRAARTVMVFYSFGSEIPTAGIVERLAADGKRVLLPFIDDGEMAAAEIRSGEELLATTYGPKEPSRREAVDPAEIDVVIAPGLAFDRRGNRLGYGGGHYDRYLSRVGPRTRRIGIGFHLQLVDEVPRESRDRPIDLLITDREALSFDSGR
jgi:5-formyltetrahydrofolate cyclo-ligase